MMKTAKEWIGFKIQSDELKERVTRGFYGDADLKILQSMLISLNSIPSVGVKEVSSYGHVSKSVINNIIAGGHPKIHNFLGAITSINIIINKTLTDMGVLKNISADIDQGVSWFDISKITDKGKINLLTSIFEDLVSDFRSMNNFEKIMSEAEKEDLIKILEAALFHVKGGLVDFGFIRSIGSRLKSISARISVKMGDAAISKIVEQGIDSISDIFL